MKSISAYIWLTATVDFLGGLQPHNVSWQKGTSSQEGKSVPLLGIQSVRWFWNCYSFQQHQASWERACISRLNVRNLKHGKVHLFAQHPSLYRGRAQICRCSQAGQALLGPGAWLYSSFIHPNKQTQHIKKLGQYSRLISITMWLLSLEFHKMILVMNSIYLFLLF